MRCPFCSADETRVIDSRLGEDGSTVRRRRECEVCRERFTTFERAELKLPQVIKSDGRREAFNEDKLRGGMTRALEKRPVDAETIEKALGRIRRRLLAGGEREVSSRQIGEWVMEELKELDPTCALPRCTAASRTSRRSARRSSACRTSRPRSRRTSNSN